MATLDDLPIVKMDNMSDDELLSIVLLMRKERRIPPAREAKTKAKASGSGNKSTKRPAKLSEQQIIATAADNPKLLEQLLATLQAKKGT